MKPIKKLLLVGTIASLGSVAAAEELRVVEESYAAPGLALLGRKGCSLRQITGKWIFATAIGRQMLPGLPPGKDMTALGTWDVKRDGTLSGVFDVTVQDTFFGPGIRYEGSVVVNRDCTGTVTFVTELGSTRTDTIAIVGRNEIIGMSQDPFNLWTYQVRRVGGFNRSKD